MKNKLILLSIILPLGLFCQNNDLNLITFSGQYNANLWLPLDDASKTYKDNGGEINVNTWKFSTGVTLFREGKYPIRVGATYMKIDHLVVDRIKSVTYSNYYTGYVSYTYSFNDPMDLKSRSRNIGFFTEPMMRLVDLKKSNGIIGLNLSVYFVEWYNSEYVTSDYINANEELTNLRPIIEKNQNRFSVSSSSLELFYLHNFNLKPNFSLGVRASLGGNMY